MLSILIRVPESRTGSALLSVRDGLSTMVEGHACASADPTIAARLGNVACAPLRPGGHPPLGVYDLVGHARTASADEEEYGAHLLCFAPRSGPALEAEAFGRLGLLVYAGASGRDGHPRRTQGGLRLSDLALATIVHRLTVKPVAELHIVRFEPRPWWAFWRKQARPGPLSTDSPPTSPRVQDEASLLLQLLSGAKRPPAPADDSPWQDDRTRERDPRSSTQHSDSDERPFQGQGGSFAGGGASAAWDTTPAAGRGPGVDSSGRMLAGAAGAVGLGLLAEAGHASTSHQTSESGLTLDAPQAGQATGETDSASATDAATNSDTSY